MSGGVRFFVSKPQKSNNDVDLANLAHDVPDTSRIGGESAVASYGAVPLETFAFSSPDDTREGYAVFGDGPQSERDRLHSMESREGEKGLELYEEDLKSRPKISRILHSLANYNAGLTPSATDMEKAAKAPQAAKLGTMLGVYLPTIQNIFGVILFIRLTWVVGVAGWLEAFFIVLLCCITTSLTAISMSAIATNGVVPGGGSYFMISRSLGPEFGGAVGILFYLGTTFASAMYILGAVEILLKYMAPVLKLVGEDIHNEADAANNYRIYGTFLLLVLFFCVFLGMRFVSIVAAISLSCVILSIISIYIGIFSSSSTPSIEVCFLGNRLLKSDLVMRDEQMYCTKQRMLDLGENVTKISPLWETYCGAAVNISSCDSFFKDNNVSMKPAIPGLNVQTFLANRGSAYRGSGQFVTGNSTETGVEGRDIIADLRTSFTILLAIFFPSCTGIMAGSNRSGDLKDASKSIPIGTIMAIATTSLVYLSCVLFFGGAIDGDVLRDKFGVSIDGRLVVSELAWPHFWVILIGSFLSTVGAGLQSLTGAPRLLNAIAKDGVIPFLGVFARTTKKGEPLFALILTAGISELGILIASLDYVAPIITMFFLMCYGFVNLACALQTLLKSPSWRPRFRFYHWTLSLAGLALCVALMFISGWYYALMAIAVALGIYKYIEYKGAENEWGDGIRGLSLSAARYALMKLDENPPHTKNWRPQILMLAKLNDQLMPRYPSMFAFASQLKAGKGLIIAATVLEGKFEDKVGEVAAAKQEIQRALKEHKVKGFTQVVVSNAYEDGMGHLVQTAGLGGLNHNTIMIGWPYGWRHDTEKKSWRSFVTSVRQAEAASCALMVLKGVQMFPTNAEKLSGTIDIWWIVHDGGLLMLLPFLLQQHKVWRSCTLRIFTVAQMEDNSIQMKKDLESFLYHLRIQAHVQVVELAECDVSAYAYGRTIMMEQRSQMLKDLHLTKKEKEVVSMTDLSHQKSKLHTHEEADEENADDVVYDAQQPLSDTAGKSKSGNGSLFADSESANAYTFSPSDLKSGMDKMKGLLHLKPEKKNVRRMHTAVRINEVIVERSHDAKLILINLPGPPKRESGYENYMEYLEVLTEGLERTVLVRGSGREVITIYS
ncbi:solute carrier family 12 member 4-like isoform X2 [Watersipora subatra]|uniref:solute carrier family 12 member 4-like isoform X2 n=1 Tax=Watersipora subatra TaxID=2589382 RepID=UPI00355C104F